LKPACSDGHAERVATITATKLQLLSTPRQQSDAMTGHSAPQRMPHFSQPFRLKQKRMTAMTGVLRQTAAFRHFMNKVPEPAAAIPDKLAEALTSGVGRGFPLEQQRVTAIDANVFTMVRALACLRIRVAAQETRQIMPHVRRRPVIAKQGFPTRTPRLFSRRFRTAVVAKAVAENAADQSADREPELRSGRSCREREKRLC
jgi:hypothetical protein